MLYAIISEDVTDSLPLRTTARADHLARLETLKEQGRLVLAGPRLLKATHTCGKLFPTFPA